MFRLVQWFRSQRGSTSLEYGLIVATAVTVAGTFAGGVGNAGMSAARHSQSGVTRGVKLVGLNLAVTQRSHVSTTVLTGGTYILRNQKTTLTAGQTARVINQWIVSVRNKGKQAIPVDQLMIGEQDKTERVSLCNPGSGTVTPTTFGCSTAYGAAQWRLTGLGSTFNTAKPVLEPGRRAILTLTMANEHIGSGTEVHIFFIPTKGKAEEISFNSRQLLHPYELLR